MPTPEYHARLNPSAAHRWLNCPASVALTKNIPVTTSQYAEAGRLAHAIAELKARKRFEVMNNRTFNSQLKKLKEDTSYAAEMDGYTDRYVEVLEQHAMSFSTPPFIALETSVPVGAITGELKDDGTPATGTADCIQIADGVLWVTDYKNGAGVPVSAEENPQMMLYALGALMLYAPIYGDTIQTIKMTIVQPALHSVSDWCVGRELLENWGNNVVRPVAMRIDNDDTGEPYPGSWCRFCSVKNVCRTKANDMLALEAFGNAEPAGSPRAKTISGPLMTDAEVGDALERGKDLVAWYNDLRDYALQACLAGKDIPGFKAVAGRTSRDWDDLDAAFADLQALGIPEAVLYERKPATVAGLEKALGKKVFEESASSHVVVRAGKPTLVDSSDRRPPYNAAEQAFTVVPNG